MPAVLNNSKQPSYLQKKTVSTWAHKNTRAACTVCWIALSATAATGRRGIQKSSPSISVRKVLALLLIHGLSPGMSHSGSWRHARKAANHGVACAAAIVCRLNKGVRKAEKHKETPTHSLEIGCISILSAKRDMMSFNLRQKILEHLHFDSVQLFSPAAATFAQDFLP
jgi:hypothetical protein